MAPQISFSSLLCLGLWMIICPRLYSSVRAPGEVIIPGQESVYFGNFWIGVGRLHNLAWDEGSPYEFSDPKAWGAGLGFGKKWGPLWCDVSVGFFGNSRVDIHRDTVDGQVGDFARSGGMIWGGVQARYVISLLENRLMIEPLGGAYLIYEEALVYPVQGSIVWEISEFYPGPAFGIKTEYDINDNWRIAGSLLHCNTTPRFDRATVMILFPDPLHEFLPNAARVGCGIDLWLKDGRYKSVNIFFTLAAL